MSGLISPILAQAGFAKRKLIQGIEHLIKKLFANGEQGAWYDPSDLSTLFQDVEGTIPVTTDGQPVALMLDKSGNDNHATQPTLAKRPIYRTDDARHWLEPDGVDDNMVIPSILDVISSFIAARVTGGSSIRRYVIAGEQQGVHFGNGGNISHGAFKNPDELLSGVSDSNDHVATVFSQGAGAECFSDGVSRVTGFLSKLEVNRLFVRPDALFFFGGRFYGAIIIETDERARQNDIESYLAKKSGVTL